MQRQERSGSGQEKSVCPAGAEGAQRTWKGTLGNDRLGPALGLSPLSLTLGAPEMAEACSALCFHLDACCAEEVSLQAEREVGTAVAIL